MGAVSGRPLRVVVVADTHLRGSTSPADGLQGQPGPADGLQGRPGPRWLPEAADEVLAGCDAVLHAGDVLDAPVLDRLAEVAAAGGARPPVYAVLGNNDGDLAGVLPPRRRLELGGVRIGMIHDSGPTAGRAGRMRRRFPDDQVVVFGHSHAPCDEEGVDGQRLFNPGSPTQRRAQPRHSIGELTVADGAVVGHRIIDLD